MHARQFRVRLTHTPKLPQDIEYMTLSRWCGGVLSSKLTKDKESNDMDNIELKTLPQTFQEAVAVTHRLGISYLWTDACVLFAELEHCI